VERGEKLLVVSSFLLGERARRFSTGRLGKLAGELPGLDSSAFGQKELQATKRANGSEGRKRGLTS
jgi:hypothetical protein